MSYNNLLNIGIFFLIFPLGGCGIFGCGEDVIPISYISSSSCEFNNYGIDDREALYVVNSEDEFNELIGCRNLNVEVDYGLNSLVIGRFVSYSCGELTSQTLISRCNRTDLEVEIEGRDCHAINVITFGAIIPKGFENERFKLKVREN